MCSSAHSAASCGIFLAAAHWEAVHSVAVDWGYAEVCQRSNCNSTGDLIMFNSGFKMLPINNSMSILFSWPQELLMEEQKKQEILTREYQRCQWWL